MDISVWLTMKDYYYILGVDANCTTEEVKNAYRKLSKKFHPDVNENDSYFKSHFIEIQEAYGILSDPDTRKWYDDRRIDTKLDPPVYETPKQGRYPRTTAVDVIFTIILIGLTVLFGKYVVTSISGSYKTAVASKEAVVTETTQVAAAPAKHHKKKKHSYIASDYFERTPVPLPSDKPGLKKPAQPAVVKTNIAKANIKPFIKIRPDTFKPKPQPIVMVAKPALPVRTISNVISGDMPYSSYLRSNITGVVNMRRLDKLNSDVVAVIPTHSKVLILQKGDNYYKIQFNGDEGYVPKWTVLTK